RRHRLFKDATRRGDENHEGTPHHRRGHGRCHDRAPLPRARACARTKTLSCDGRDRQCLSGGPAPRSGCRKDQSTSAVELTLYSTDRRLRLRRQALWQTTRLGGGRPGRLFFERSRYCPGSSLFQPRVQIFWSSSRTATSKLSTTTFLFGSV